MTRVEKDALIEVKAVSKKYCTSLKYSLGYALGDGWRALWGLRPSSSLRKKEFWALKDVSFQLHRGQCLGLLGHNGAGKSTMLKMLNGLVAPDLGEIVMRGRVGALIELGAGFNPLLSGRENIYNNAAVLGMPPEETDKHFQRIVDFAEIGDFLEMPVQNYSSGMRVRLGFAVAAHLQPDILLIDEVLAVGDLGFVLKCLRAIDEMLPTTAVIFISHNMPLVARICDRLLLLEKGRVIYHGEDVSKGIEQYYLHYPSAQQQYTSGEDARILSITLNNHRFFGNEQETPLMLTEGDDLQVEIEYQITPDYPEPEIMFLLQDREQRGVASTLLNTENGLPRNNGAVTRARFTIPAIPLAQGQYFVTLNITGQIATHPLVRIPAFCRIYMRSPRVLWTPIEFRVKIHAGQLKESVDSEKKIS